MSDPADPADDAAARPDEEPYEPPRIAWREPYEPVSFGASCAKQPGNPGCNPGPFSA
jgi:hypothetical protein